MKTYKIALIGLGPHAKRIYYPYIEQLVNQLGENAEFSLLVELASQKTALKAFIAKGNMTPTESLYLSDVEASFTDTPPERLLQAFDKYDITHVIIATEPKAHKKYIQFSIARNLKILTDKPITSPIGLTPLGNVGSDAGVQQIVTDVRDILTNLSSHPHSSVTVQTQRRYHNGYSYVLATLKDIVREYGIPITYLDIFHSDGMWNMPGEFATRENHPYKYGYGKLMHSGYHFIDLMQQIVKINESLDTKIPDSIDVYSRVLHPKDHYAQFNKNDYIKLFNQDSSKFNLLPNPLDGSLSTYGELDTFSQWNFSKDGHTITTANVNLMQSGYSLRAWSELPEDTYKSNGRVRHERLNIHVGPLMNIQVHSYQSVEVGDLADIVGVGSKQHFDIYIFRNSKLIGGKPLDRIYYGTEESHKHVGSTYLGQNEQPRFDALNEFFFSEKPSLSSIESHMVTSRLMSVLYSNQGKQSRGEVPYTKYIYRELFDE